MTTAVEVRWLLFLPILQGKKILLMSELKTPFNMLFAARRFASVLKFQYLKGAY